MHRVVELAEELNVPITFDVNLRQDLWDDVQAAREAVYRAFERSCIVKLSDDKLQPLLDATDAEEAA